MRTLLIVLSFGILSATVADVVRADPPSHAPAHGWR